MYSEDGNFVTLTIDNVPYWLRESKKYRFLLKYNITTNFNISSANYKETEDISSLDEFIKVFSACKYWIRSYPQTLYQFMKTHKHSVLGYFYPRYDYDIYVKRLVDGIINDFTFKYVINDDNILKILFSRNGDEILILKTVMKNDTINMLKRFQNDLEVNIDGYSIKYQNECLYFYFQILHNIIFENTIINNINKNVLQRKIEELIISIESR